MKKRLRLKKIPSIIVASLMIISLVYMNFMPAFKVFATDYGSGDKALHLDFSGGDNFSVSNVTVDGNPWSGTADEFRNNTGHFEIEGIINSQNGSRPEIRYGGNLSDYMASNGSIEVRPESETEYSFDISLDGIGTELDDEQNVISFIGFTIEEEGNFPPPVSNDVEVQFDAASFADNRAIFDVDGTNVSVTVNGANIDGGRIVFDRNDIPNVTFTVDSAFNSETMDIIIIGDDNYRQTLSLTTNYTSLDGVNFPGNSLHFGIEPKGNEPNPGPGTGGSNTQDYQGNSTATLNYSINGAIEYDSDSLENLGINFFINDIRYKPDNSKVSYTEGPAYERDENGQVILDDNQNPIPIKDPETNQPMTEKTGVTISGDTIHYDADGSKVKFTFMMNPGTLMTGLTINGQVINNLPSTKEELQEHYFDHALYIEVDNIDKADEYNIEITGRYPNADEEFMGNFLWDYNEDGYTGPDDKVLNATMHFVSAEYDGHVYTTPEEIESLGGVFIWRDAERKNHYTDEREGVGEAQFPVGTKLTVAIIPDAGYQLVSFGINGGEFEPQEEIGTYTFGVQGGPFHLQAEVEQVANVVKSKTNKVTSGSIKLGGEEEAMSIGTARLDVEDTDISEEQISNFEQAASGYEISNYLNISLFNTVFKGTETESWDTEVKDINHKAKVTLKLDKDVNGDEVVIVHEKHDGTYEVIPTTYDAANHTITFETDSFSNYAIASKEYSAAEKVAKSLNPKTGDNIYIYFGIIAASTLGLVLTLKRKKA